MAEINIPSLDLMARKQQSETRRHNNSNKKKLIDPIWFSPKSPLLFFPLHFPPDSLRWLIVDPSLILPSYTDTALRNDIPSSPSFSLEKSGRLYHSTLWGEFFFRPSAHIDENPLPSKFVVASSAGLLPIKNLIFFFLFGQDRAVAQLYGTHKKGGKVLFSLWTKGRFIPCAEE